MDLLKKLNWYFLLISLTEMEISENSNNPMWGLIWEENRKRETKGTHTLTTET